jgi:hypothetical protein
LKNLIFLGLLSLAPAFASGNSAAAALCQKGGYVNLMRTDGSLFSNTGECVSYAAKGGQLVPIPATLVLTEPTVITTPKCWVGVTTGVTPITPALWNSRTYGHPGANLCFQADGNLVVYEAGWVGDPSHALWNSGTAGNTNAFLNFQSDGNLVVYSSTASPLWNSGTYGHPGDCVIFQADGNLVIYTGCTTP